MKGVGYFLLGLIIISFFGCARPKLVKKEPSEEKKEEKIEEEKQKEINIVKPEEKPVERVEEGKATREEIQKAIKGEEIPLPELPAVKGDTQISDLPGKEEIQKKEKKFVKPEEVSEELSQIFKNVYFDFDKYDIRPDAAETLKKIGEYMLKNPDIKILIEGHCDERGTREYNLVLGEQRALSVRRFLIIMGVSPKRMYTVSYGEDMPADPGHNEEAWAKNRRCEFKIEIEK
jgi:peptidoglycan-associated lipoprotein